MDSATRTWLLRLSLALNLAFILFGIAVIRHKGGLAYLEHKYEAWNSPPAFPILEDGQYRNRVDQYAALPGVAGDVVIAGDSLVEGADWSLLLGTPVRNRGIGGEPIEGLMARLPSILGGPPRAIVLEIGSNNIEEIEHDGLPAFMRRYEALIAAIRKQDPQTQLIVNTVIPVGVDHHDSTATNRITHSINEQLRVLCAKHGCDIVDAFALMATPEGALDEAYSFDGVHPNAAGLERWALALAPVIKPAKVAAK